MKIAVDVTPVQPGGECGGVKQLVMELLRGFGKSAAPDRFVLLTAYYNDDIFKEFDKFGMQRICAVKEAVAGKPFSLLRQGLDILKRRFVPYIGHNILSKNNISVLFCPMTAPAYHEAGIPTVSVICDLQHLYYPSFFSRQELAHRNNFYEQLKKKADYVICISSYTRKTVMEKLNIPAERIFSIPICVHARLPVPGFDLTQVVLRKNRLEDAKYCVYPANLWPHKNHKMLLAAFGMFIRKYPMHNLCLVLTGATIENDRVFEDAVAQMGLRDKVRFVGYLTETELSVIWHNSYFLIFPSLFEGFGIPLVEAMMYGKPILAGNVTSIPEVAGNAALYFDPRKPDQIAGAICKIMEDKDLYDSLVMNGRERLKCFDFDDMVGRYSSILHKAAEEGSFGSRIGVDGIYDDAWAGRLIRVTYNASKQARIFKLKVYLPDWHPRIEMKIKVKSNGGSSQYVLGKGGGLLIKECLPAAGGTLDIRVSGGFVPGNGDERTLTFMVREALITEEHTGEVLYEFKNK